MKIKSNVYLVVFVAVVMFSSCSTPKIAYFEDVQSGEAMQVANDLEIRIKPEDKIRILVNSKDPLLINLFNLPIISPDVSSTSTSGTGRGVSGYTVDKDGNIDFPVLGQVKVAGLTRSEVASKIKSELINKSLVKDPVVTVEYMNLVVSVLGEVANPGCFEIKKDHLSLLEAIGMAGDLTVYGERENVLVQREENGKKVIYRVNLNSGKDLYSSPVYYLQQNDIVYVEPNQTKARQSTVNGNNIRSTAFWISIASLLTSIAILIVN